jgi:hypothetical protein
LHGHEKSNDKRHISFSLRQAHRQTCQVGTIIDPSTGDMGDSVNHPLTGHFATGSNGPFALNSLIAQAHAG